MKKADFIQNVATASILTTEEAKAAVDTVFEEIAELLQDGDTLTISGFGTFRTAKRGARQGRNPQTGETIQIPAKITASWTPSKAFKNKLNQ